MPLGFAAVPAPVRDWPNALLGVLFPAWYDIWANLRVEAYLNAADMREFKIED